jgi:integrase/recombinase XerD
MTTFKVIPIFDGIHSFTVVSEDEIPVADVDDYLEHLATCGRSAYTLQSYARGLADFITWLHQHHILLATVTREHIGEYIGEFARSQKRGACRPNPTQVNQINPKTRKTSPGLQHKNSTINHRLSVLTGFFEFCIQRDNLRGQGAWYQRVNPVNPAAGQGGDHGMIGRDLPPRRRTGEFRRRKTRELPKPVSPELAMQLIEQAGSWRDKAILTLLLRTGQRIGDWSDFAGHHGILGMTTADVDEVSCTITVRLKVSRDEHRVPVTDDFWPLYRRYLEHERPQEVEGSALWVATRRGKGHPLSYATFESALRYLGHKLGANVNAHMFRHTLAQGILETTGNLKVAQEILGHAHLSTTADQYMSVDEISMVRAVADVKVNFATASADGSTTAETTPPLAQSQPDRYVFPYDPLTLEELNQISLTTTVIKAGGLIP